MRFTVLNRKKKERKAILSERLRTDLPHSLKTLLQKITSHTEHWKIEISCQKKSECISCNPSSRNSNSQTVKFEQYETPFLFRSYSSLPDLIKPSLHLHNFFKTLGIMLCHLQSFLLR